MRKLLISLVFAAFVLPTWQVSALPDQEAAPKPLMTPGQVISGINSYRAANGLPPYQSNSTLMQLAQGQADYQASIETVTHTGPGGTRPIDRAYSIGYGSGNAVFVSEIIYGGYTATVDIAITWWKGSSIHNSTMLASTYQEIGAGVASSGDRMFFTAVTGYVVGAPAPANAGVPSASSEEGEASAESEEPAAPALIIIPVTRSEPQEDGSIIHTVRTGQALWNIAAVYDVPLEELLEINNLPQNAIIFSGDEILVQEATEPVVEAEPTSASTNTPVATEAPLPTSETTEVAASNEEAASEAEANNNASNLAALSVEQQPATTGFFQGSTARWIVVIAFVGLLGVLGTSLILQQRTVETAPVAGNLDPLTTPLNVALSSESQKELAFEEQAKEEQLEKLQRLGEVALMAYDLKVDEIQPQKYWLNATFKLVGAPIDNDSEQNYLLRVHDPKLHKPAAIRSEMQWLQFLNGYDDIYTPEPVKNIEGKWITMMDAPGVPEKRACTILKWQSGEHIKDEQINQKRMEQIGALLGHFHNASKDFKTPKGFTRPRWDLVGLQGKALNVKPATALEAMTEDQLDTLDEVTQKISGAIAELDKSEDAFGMIHGDLQTHNLLFKGDEIKAIDFDASGWGYYVYDVAISLQRWRNHPGLTKFESALLKGYRAVRPLPDQQLKHMSTLLAGRNMAMIYWLTTRLKQPAFQKETEKEIGQLFGYLTEFLNSETQ